jgi:hypothetical protein
MPGWQVFEAAKSYNHDNLYDLVDGQSDAYFVYGFEQVSVQRYQNDGGTRLEVQIWQVKTAADAYGLFTISRSGTPASVGSEGDTDPGRRIIFWQNRYFVQIFSDKPIPDIELVRAAKAVSSALPVQGLSERGFIFFHEEISIQDDIWLGGENILKLSQATNGVLGRYEINGVTARLVLIEYPGAAEAAAGLKALQAGSVTDLAASGVQDRLLGAVTGPIDEAAAGNLLKEGLVP